MDRITKLFSTEFFPLVVKKTGVELNVLMECWEEFNRGQKREVKNVQRETPDRKKVYSATELDKLKIKELKAICEELNISKSGLKRQIIDNILTHCDVKEEKRDDSPKKLNLENLRALPVKITQNENGHWIHEDTKIVFTSDEEYIDGISCRLAIGYEDEDGAVEDLTAKMIDTCDQYGFRYREPVNIVI